ncbi:fasciclin domain-containing protein [Chitinophagaceae bacterium LB-8]|uniref:Fasciclin domain-containing protein n=1 Tax=Paraflavisolibacter caeni TaxID=2982496 RepID=A0A9X2XUP6_9BACT|nr:fasciclin domain-containing protein [Paraflavisolibacter caeni]MCU7549416.1 fasciclin domain-containing protein [Paraflavisolibacter caeni]
MKMNLKRFIPGSSLLMLCLVAISMFSLTSCRKDDTYYNYKTTAGAYNGTTYEYLQSQTGLYDSLLLVLGRVTGLADSLKTGSVTLFAANNSSFSLALQNINQARKDSLPKVLPPVTLSTMDSTTLDMFLARYIIPGKLASDSLKGYTDGRMAASIRYGYNMQVQYVPTNAAGFLNGGPKAICFSDPKNSLFVKNWVRVNTMTVDIKTSNGIVHLLPPGHDFGFGYEFIRLINQKP